MQGITRKMVRMFSVGVVGVGLLALTSGVAEAATGTVGPHRTGTVNCSSPDSVSLTTLASSIKAVNKTTATDYQNVAFQPVHFKWNGSAWAENATGMKLYGKASDVASPSIWRDWATGTNQGDGRQTHSMIDRGSYRVAVRMYWYNSSWQVTGSDYLWASTYTTPIGAVVQYCTR